MLSGSSVLLVTLCVCAALGARRSSKGGGGRGLPSGHHRDLLLWRDLEASLDDNGDSELARIQRGLPGSSYRSVNSLGGFGKTRAKDNSFWSGKNEAAIELEEESDDLDNTKTASDEYDYMDATPVRQAFSGERMRPHESLIQYHESTLLAADSILSTTQVKLMKLASQNARRVMEKGKCATPAERCVPVAGDPGKKYWPNCALLHQCDDTTGCCTSNSHSCQPRDSNHIDLYFYVFEDSEKGGNRGGVQRLTFRNDTSCECRTRPKVKQPICQNLTPSCTCPKHFESVIRNGECVCDCIPGSPSYKSCRRYKRGKKFFTQACIQEGKCAEPICEYGSYLPSKNRCMRKSEKERKRKMKSKYK